MRCITTNSANPWFIFMGLVFINMLLMPADMLPSDPYGWFTEARVYVQTGSIKVPPEVAVKLPHGLFIENPNNGQLYSKYGVASSLAVVIPLYVAKLFGAAGRSELIIVNTWQACVSGVLGALLYQLSGKYLRHKAIRLSYVLACFYATFMWFYIRAQGTEIYQCLYFTGWFYSMVSFWRERPVGTSERPSRWPLAMWCFCLLLVHTRPFFLLMVPSTLAVLVIARRPRSGEVRVPIWRTALLLAPSLAVVLSWMAVNRLKFGYWTATGYHVMGNGGETASWRNLPEVSRFVLDPTLSVFVTFPVLTFALLAMWRLSTQMRNEWLIAVAHAVVFALIPAAYGIVEGGWSEGPRYLMFILPALSLPFILTVEWLMSGRVPYRAALVGMVVVLLLSSFCWWNVIARPMFAWHRIVHNAGPVLDIETANQLLSRQHGMVLRDLDVTPERLDELPLMRNVRAMAPKEYYSKYRQDIASWTRADNFMWYSGPIVRE